VRQKFAQAALLSFVNFSDFRKCDACVKSQIVDNTDPLKFCKLSEVHGTSVFRAGLVDIQNRLGWYMFLELLIEICEGFIDTLDYTAQMTAGNVDMQSFTTKGLQATVRSMERTLLCCQ